MKTSVSSVGLLLAAFLISTRASAQDAYFRALEIPPNSAGTCTPIRARSDQHASFTGHLLIKSVVPGQDRDLTVVVDSLRRTVGYSEMDLASTGPGSNVGDVYVARFKEPKVLTGFAMHSTTKMPVPDFKHFDSTSLRRIGETSRTVTIKRPLTPDELRRARDVAEWLRKRCPSTQ